MWDGGEACHAAHGLDNVTRYIHTGKVEYGFELAKELISQTCSQQRREVAQRIEDVVNQLGVFLAVQELVLEVNGEDSLHPIERVPLAYFVPEDESDMPGVGITLLSRFVFFAILEFILNFLSRCIIG